MVDTAVYDGDIDTLDIIFNPPPELSGKISMLNDVNEVLNAGLRYLGLKRCNDNAKDLSELERLLNDATEHWLGFDADRIGAATGAATGAALVSGDAAAGQIRDGLGRRARADKPTLRYAYPREGFTGWMDNLVVLKGAANPDNARKFLNFMLHPENAAALTNYARYSAGVTGTTLYLDQDLDTAREFNIPATAPRSEYVLLCGERIAHLYNRIWADLLR